MFEALEQRFGLICWVNIPISTSAEQREDAYMLLATLKSAEAIPWLLARVDMYKPVDAIRAQDSFLIHYPNALHLVELRERAAGEILAFIVARPPDAIPKRHLILFGHIILHVEGYEEADRERIIAYITKKSVKGPHQENVRTLNELLLTLDRSQPFSLMR